MLIETVAVNAGIQNLAFGLTLIAAAVSSYCMAMEERSQEQAGLDADTIAC